MKIRLLAILFVGLLAAGVVCGQDEQADAPSYPVADTPEQAVKNLRQSYLDSDTDAFMACFNGSADYERMMSALFDFGVSVLDFNNKLVEAYGEEAAEEFEGPDPPLAELANMTMDDLTFEVDGDTAVCTAGEDDEPLDLVRIDGVWYVTMISEDEIPKGEELDVAVALMEALAYALDSVAWRIGANGVTIEQIEEELHGAIIMYALEVEMPQLEDMPVEESPADAAEASYPPADTPEQALANMRQACAAGDTAALLACFETSADGVRILSGAFDLGLAIVDFRERLVAKFGEEAVAGFDAVVHGPLDILSEITEGEVTIAADGNTATCAPAEDGSGETLDLVLRDGVWLVVVPDMPTDEEEIEEMVAMQHKMTGVIRGMIDRVDDDGVTIEQLEQDLNDVFAAMAEEDAEQETQEQPPSPPE